MRELPIRRWNLAFIARRWRHLFWAVPLLGLLAGLGPGIYFSHNGKNVATGVVQIRTAASPPGLPEALSQLHSAEILALAASKAGLPNLWKMDEEACAAALRKVMTMQPLRGTSLVRVSIKSRNLAEAIDIWNAWAEAAEERLLESERVKIQPELAAANRRIQALQEDVEAEREALAALGEYDDLLHRPPGSPASEQKVVRDAAAFEEAKAVLEEARTLLERAALEKVTIQVTATPAFLIHDRPRVSPPFSWSQWPTLRILAIWIGIGLTAGMILSPILAYLFELLFPRKRPAETVMPLSP